MPFPCIIAARISLRPYGYLAWAIFLLFAGFHYNHQTFDGVQFIRYPAPRVHSPQTYIVETTEIAMREPYSVYVGASSHPGRSTEKSQHMKSHVSLPSIERNQ